MKKILAMCSVSILSCLLVLCLITPVSAESIKEYQVTEEQILLIESGFSIEQVLVMSVTEIDNALSNPIRTRSSGYVTSKSTRVPGSERYFTKKDLGIHPSWKYRASVYTSYFYFNIAEKEQLNVSLGVSTGGTASFSVSVSKAASSGGWISDKIDNTRPSKPMMYGTGYTYRLKVDEYDSYTGEYIRTYYLNTHHISSEGARGYYY